MDSHSFAMLSHLFRETGKKRVVRMAFEGLSQDF